MRREFQLYSQADLPFMEEVKLISRFKFVVIGIGSFIPFILLFILFPSSSKLILIPAVIWAFASFSVSLKFSQYLKKVNFTYKHIQIGELQFDWADIKSYKLENAHYFETLTIKLFSGKRIHLTGYSDGKKARQFQKHKNRFLYMLAYHNSKAPYKIPHRGFYQTIWAQLFFYLVCTIGAIGLLMLILGKVKNPIPVIMIAGLGAVLYPQIFKKKNT